MSARKEKEKLNEEEKDEIIANILKSIVDEDTRKTIFTPPQPTERIISNINIRGLIEFLSEKPIKLKEYRPDDPVIKHIKSVLDIVHTMATEFREKYIKDGLGRIYHPLYGSPIVEARFGELAHMLAISLREMWNSISQELDKYTPQQLKEILYHADLASRLAFLVLPEVYAQLMTLYYSNAPPSARPPLINASLGYELIEYGGRALRPLPRTAEKRKGGK